MKRKLLFGLFLGTLLFFKFGCSKNAPPLTPVVVNPVVVPVKETPTPPPASTARLLPIKIESPLETITIKYQGNSSLVASLDFGKSKKSLQFIYNKQNVLVAGLVEDPQAQEYQIDYFLDVHKNIFQVSYYVDLNNVISPSGYYLLTYNALNQIVDAKRYSAKNILVNSYNYGYDLLTNINSIITNQEDAKKLTYTFDQKNGIFKHVNYAPMISLEISHHLLNSIANNISTKTGNTPAQNLSYTYEYNSEDFPSQVTVNEAGVKTVYKVTYKTL